MSTSQENICTLSVKNASEAIGGEDIISTPRPTTQEAQNGEKSIQPENQQLTGDTERKRKTAIRRYYWSKLRKIHLKLLSEYLHKKKYRSIKRKVSWRKYNLKRKRLRKLEKKRKTKLRIIKKKNLKSPKTVKIRKYLKQKLREVSVLLKEKPEKGKTLPKNYSEDYFDELIKKYVNGYE